MKKWSFLLIIVALAFLQLTWPASLNFFNCKPDFLLVLIVALVFYLDFKVALALTVLAGLAKDVLQPEPFAINTILFSIWSYSVYLLNRQISTENYYVQAAIVMVVALLNNITIGLVILNSGIIIPPGIFLRNVIICASYTTVLSPFIFKLAKKIAA